MFRNRETIYVGTVDFEKGQLDRYPSVSEDDRWFFYHQLFGPENLDVSLDKYREWYDKSNVMGTSANLIGIEYLSGYVEGATQGRWDVVNVQNGFPEHIKTRLHPGPATHDDIRPLNERELVDLVRIRTSLYLHYSELWTPSKE